MGTGWELIVRRRHRQSDSCECARTRGSIQRPHKLTQSTSDLPFPTQLYDLHRKQVVYTLSSHTDTISSLRLAPTGSHLLSLSFDSTLKVWDVRPFAISNGNGARAGDESQDERLTGTFTGAAVGGNDSLLVRADWSRDGRRVVSGSCDRTCVVWDMEDMKGRVVYKLPGHRGTCTAAALHPREPIGE